MISQPLPPDLFQRAFALSRRLFAAGAAARLQTQRLELDMARVREDRQSLDREAGLIRRAFVDPETKLALMGKALGRMESLGERLEGLQRIEVLNRQFPAIPEAEEILAAIKDHYAAEVAGSVDGGQIQESLKRLAGWIEARRALNRTPHQDAVLAGVLENAMTGAEDIFPDHFYSLAGPAAV